MDLTQTEIHSIQQRAKKIMLRRWHIARADVLEALRESTYEAWRRDDQLSHQDRTYLDRLAARSGH